MRFNHSLGMGYAALGLFTCSMFAAAACSSDSNVAAPGEPTSTATMEPTDEPSMTAPTGTMTEPDMMMPPPKMEALAPELGNGMADSVAYTDIAVAKDGLNTPLDLAFNPLSPSQLFVVNQGTLNIRRSTMPALLVINDAPMDTRKPDIRGEPIMGHFMHNATGLAFGAKETTFGSDGTFATCGESRNENSGGDGSGNDFMGPVLWTSDLAVLTKKDPAGLGSHIDMLHSTPLCMGITHQSGNVYWVTNGLKGDIQRYDFGKDHNVGQDDHSDGEIVTFAKAAMKRVEKTPSHLAFRAEDNMLYFADSGNGKIRKLDTKTGAIGKMLPNRDRLKREKSFEMKDVVVSDFATGELKVPSGLTIHNNLVFVSDAETGFILAFDLEGKQVNKLDTKLGAGVLAGITFGPDNKLYFADKKASRVVRVDPK
jgi:DNA-binding beta-propeller fold protein YncE